MICRIFSEMRSAIVDAGSRAFKQTLQRASLVRLLFVTFESPANERQVLVVDVLQQLLELALAELVPNHWVVFKVL